VQAVGEGGGGGFVDQFFNIEPRQFTGDARGFALTIAEVGGHADDGFGDGMAVGAFDIFLDALEYQRREFFGAERAITQTHFSGAAHVALEQRSRQVRVGVQALFGGLAYQDTALIIQPDHARGQQLAKGIGHQFSGIPTPDGREAVGGSQVDSYDHYDKLPLWSVRICDQF